MSEILQIFHNSSPSHYHFQHGLVNIESQVNEVWESECPLSSILNFGCSEVAENSFMGFLVDESSSKVTTEVEQPRSSRKRKLEAKREKIRRKMRFLQDLVPGCSNITNKAAIVDEIITYVQCLQLEVELDEVEVDSQKKSVACDSELVEPPRAKRNTNYIHVRARRGQATDSHSIAERPRRKKITRKMLFLIDLVPGCSNMTNKAAVLDEIISYVQCLQMEVEVLTLKLAATTTSVDLEINNSLPQEAMNTF